MQDRELDETCSKQNQSAALPASHDSARLHYMRNDSNVGATVSQRTASPPESLLADHEVASISEFSADSDSSSSDDTSSVDSNPCPSPTTSTVQSASSDSGGDNADSDNSESEASVEYLYDGSDISSEEGLLNVLKLYVEQRWTKVSLDRSLKVMKKMLPQPNELPSDGQTALKKLERLTVSCTEKEYSYCN